MSHWSDLIRDVPDFPKPGIGFKDITPVLADADGFAGAMAELAEPWRGVALDAVIGIESRGFILGAALARDLGVGFVPVRKPGKLPARTLTLDYGSTWQEVLPTGLPSLDPQQLGSVMVVKAKRTSSVLAVTAWDAASSAYWIYTSKNDGLTWVRGAKVVGGTFVPMDEVATIDGNSAANFPRNLTFLTPLLDAQGRPATVNVGAPWAHDASKRTPAGPL